MLFCIWLKQCDNTTNLKYGLRVMLFCIWLKRLINGFLVQLSLRVMLFCIWLKLSQKTYSITIGLRVMLFCICIKWEIFAVARERVERVNLLWKKCWVVAGKIFEYAYDDESI